MKKVLLVDNGSRHSLALAHHFAKYDVRRVKYKNLTAGLIDGADLVVLSGGFPSIFQHYWFYKKQIQLIKTATKPVIGICLGFELIVLAYGGSLFKLKRKATGLKRIDIIGNNVGLEPKKAEVWEAHRWGAKLVPHEFLVIAGSGSGAEIIKHKTKNILGCQFHPEVDRPANDGAEILHKLLASIGI